jgi:hypothetical protein
MRTTLDLSDHLIAQLLKAHPFRSKTEAIHTAIKEFIQRRKAKKLMALFGQVDIDPDWRKHEEEELRELKRRSH